MRLFAVAAVLLLAACTLLTAFDPEGQPCDTSANGAAQCQERFHCEGGFCRKGAYDAGAPDGG